MDARKAPKGAKPTYLGPPLDHMQDLIGQLDTCVERHSAVNAQARAEIDALRFINAELRTALGTIIGILDDPTGGEHVRDMRAALHVARTTLRNIDEGE